ncbi:MAG: 50S ribosomal protein L17 [Pedosphaera sp.]|nr:50S ribosomal protein L17 [Pedosphaera sp.]
MRHRHRKAKLGRTTEHRTALLSNLVCSLIKHRRIETTLAKAKAARVVADKMVTLSKKGQSGDVSLQYRRLVAARLQRRPRRFFPKKNGVPGREQRKQWRENEDVVRILFEDIAPGFAERNGGYTRVIKLGRRRGDAAEMAILEWVSDSDQPATEDQPAQVKKKTEPEETAAEETEKATAEESAEETAKNKSAEEPETEESEDTPSGETAEEETEEAPAVETEAEMPAKDTVEEESSTEAQTEDVPEESGEAETKPEDKEKKSE